MKNDLVPGTAERISFLVKDKFFLISLKISYYKNFLIDWPNLGEARASVLHRFRDACLVYIPKFRVYAMSQCDLNHILTIPSRHFSIFISFILVKRLGNS